MKIPFHSKTTRPSPPHPTPLRVHREDRHSLSVHFLPNRDVSFPENGCKKGFWSLVSRFYRVLPSFTEFYRVLPSFMEFYRVSMLIERVLQLGFTVLPSFTKFQ